MKQNDNRKKRRRCTQQKKYRSSAGLLRKDDPSEKTLEAVQEHLKPEYIQHNPVVPTLALGLGNFFNGVVSARANARVVVHQIIAAEDHVWAHVNFLNLFNDDPDDRGVAGVDIYRFDNTDGKVIEHWDVLQPIPDPQTAANGNGMF